MYLFKMSSSKPKKRKHEIKLLMLLVHVLCSFSSKYPRTQKINYHTTANINQLPKNIAVNVIQIVTQHKFKVDMNMYLIYLHENKVSSSVRLMFVLNSPSFAIMGIKFSLRRVHIFHCGKFVLNYSQS